MKDNGPGYLNYNKVDIHERLNYVSDTWEIFGTMRLNYKNYLELIRTTRVIELSTGLEKQFNDWFSTKIKMNRIDSFSNYYSDIFQSKSYQIGITLDF